MYATNNIRVNLKLLLHRALAGGEGLSVLRAGHGACCRAGTLRPPQWSVRSTLRAQWRPQRFDPLHAQLQQISTTSVHVQVRSQSSQGRATGCTA